ncbi:MAG TPA: chorismate-binding protein, partial [Chryseosolibacter sp.]
MSLEEFANTLNEWGRKKIPFLFLVDFEMEKPLVFTLAEIDADQLLFSINGRTNSRALPRQLDQQGKKIDFVKLPLSLDDYRAKFDKVHSRLLYGDSYLTNLTVKTGIRTTLSLREIFFACEAKYKLLLEGNFIVFSPETFVRIEDGRIFSYPMKGTIDASVSGA